MMDGLDRWKIDESVADRGVIAKVTVVSYFLPRFDFGSI